MEKKKVKSFHPFQIKEWKGLLSIIQDNINTNCFYKGNVIYSKQDLG